MKVQCIVCKEDKELYNDHIIYYYYRSIISVFDKKDIIATLKYTKHHKEINDKVYKDIVCDNCISHYKDTQKMLLCYICGKKIKEIKYNILNRKNLNQVIKYIVCSMECKTKCKREIKCEVCNEIGLMQRCSRCKDKFYCSIECQKADWSTHKKNCVAH